MIRVYADYEELSRAAAELICDTALGAVRDRDCFSMALAGGNTPRRTYEILSAPPLSNRVPWEKVHLFWGDERCVPPRDPRSNALMARRALIDHVPIPASRVHPIPCNRSPADAAKQYEALLRTFFAGHEAGFDLVLLGLGEDGHTASLLPDSPVLAEGKRRVAEVYAAEQGIYRVTLTPPLINQARVVVFLVSGESKAGVLREMLEGTAPLPARMVRPVNGELRWLVDREAAGLLSRKFKGGST